MPQKDLTDAQRWEASKARKAAEVRPLQKRTIEARRTREAFLAHLAAGKTIKVALAEPDVLRSYEWLSLARYRDPDFHARFTAAKTQGTKLRRKAPPTDQNRGEAAQELRTFAGFTEAYFHMTHQPHQLRMVEALEDAEQREIIMFLIWPEAGKSTTLENWICRDLAIRSDDRLTVISESAAHAKKMVRRVKQRFTDEVLFTHFLSRFGPFYEEGQERAGKPWQADNILIAKRGGDERDPSLRASAWFAANYGVRIDTLLVDDVQSRANLSQAAEIFGTLRQTFWTRGKGIRTFIVGNRVASGDVYDRIIDADILTRDPIIIPATGAMGAAPGEPSVPQAWETDKQHNGRGCCPSAKWHDQVGLDFHGCPMDSRTLTPMEWLNVIRWQVGEEAWWSSYMQAPAADALSTFGGALHKCLDTSRSAGPLHAVA